MVDINWGLAGNSGGFQGALSLGMALGEKIKQRRQEEEYAGALQTVFGPKQQEINGVLQPVDMSKAEAVIARMKPELYVNLQQQRAAQAQAAEQARKANVRDVAKLTEGVTDQASYVQALQAAQQLGIDTSGAPPQYDPAWVQQQARVFSFFADNEDKLPGIAEELRAAGYEPGTPEFVEAMRGVINSKYASEYVDPSGITRRRSVLNLGGTTPSAHPIVPAIAIEALRKDPSLAEQFKQKYGVDPSRYLGGGGGNATGGFQP